MKTPQDHLWQLIQRLSPAEKRYFRTHFGREENQLTRLYDWLNEQVGYEEETARRELGVPASTFKVLKAQLTDLLLRSLIAQHGKRSVTAKVHLGLEEVAHLQRLQLFEEARRRLLRLRKWCKRHELFAYQPLLDAAWETLAPARPGQLAETATARARVLTARTQLWRLEAEWESAPTPTGPPDGWELWQAAMTGIPLDHLPLTDRCRYWRLLGKAWEARGNRPEARRNYEAALALFEGKPYLRKAQPAAYLRGLLEMLTFLSRQPTPDPLTASLVSEVEACLHDYPALAPARSTLLAAQLRMSFLRMEWEKITKEWERPVLVAIAEFGQEETAVAATAHLLLANTYLVLEQPAQVQYYMRRFQAAADQVEKPLRYAADIVELISHWETGDLDIVHQRVAALRRRLRLDQDQGYSPFYELHLMLLARLAREPFERHVFASDMLLRLPEFQNDPIFPHYKWQNLERWLQAAAANRPLAEVIKSRSGT